MKMLINFFRSKPKIPYYYIRGYTKKVDISKDIPEFSLLASRIILEKKTMLNFDRLYTIYQLVKNLKDNSLAIEIGVYKGGTSKFIATLLLESNSRLIGIDTFDGHKDADSITDGQHQNNLQFIDTSFNEVVDYLSDFSNVALYKNRIQDLSLDKFMNLSFIHLDVDLFEPTRWVLNNLSPLLKKDGVILIDDYGQKTTPGIEQAVKEFLEINVQNFFHLHLITGQFILVKR